MSPRVNTYSAGNLASEQTGVPRPSQDGEIVGNAIAQLGGKVMDVANQALEKQKAYQENLDVSTAQTDYQVQYLGAKQRLTEDPTVKADQIENLLNDQSAQISSDVISRYASGSTRQAVQSAISQTQNLFRVDAVKERVKLANKEMYNTWFGTVENTINNLKEVGTPEAYETVVNGFHAMTPSIVPLTGDNLESAQKATQNAIDTATTQYVAAGIERGQEDSLEQMNVLGKFGQASEAVQKRVSDTIATALKTKSFRADITTSYNTLNANVADVAAIRTQDKTFADIEHDLAKTSYELAQGNFSASQKEDMQRRVTTLDAMRTAMLTGAYVKASDNLDTVVSLRAEAANLMKQSEGDKQLEKGVYLSDLKKYQDRLVSEFVDKQNISKKTFTTLYEDAYGVMLQDLTSKTFHQSGWEKFIQPVFGNTPKGENKVVSKQDRQPLFRIYDAAKKQDGSVDPEIMFKAYDEYLNDKALGKVVEGIFTPAQAKDYHTRAVLRKQGFAGVFTVGDMIPTAKGPRKFIGVNADGIQVEDVPGDKQVIKYHKDTGGR